ncbi:hypothetical protein H8959_003353 [Pygathrix nigripes]
MKLEMRKTENKIVTLELNSEITYKGSEQRHARFRPRCAAWLLLPCGEPRRPGTEWVWASGASARDTTGLGSEQPSGDVAQSNRATMGTAAPGPIHLLELCDQKLMEFLCNMDNKDLVWLEEIQEEAKRMFTREFSKEPELMPKTPSQKNRRKKRRISYVQDENRDPIRKRLSRRKSRSSQLSSRRLRSKDSVEKLATMVGENGSVLRRVTRAAAAAAAATMALAAPSSPTPESPTMLTEKPKDNHTQCQLVPVVEIGISERHNAEQHVTQLVSVQPLPRTLSPTPASATTPASRGILTSDEESTPKKSKARMQESVTVRHNLIAPSSLSPQVLAQKYSLVAKQESVVRRASRRLAKKTAEEPAASGRIICHSYLERLLNVEVPEKVGPEQESPEEAEPVAAAEPEVPGNNGNNSWPRSDTEIANSTPNSKPAASSPETPPAGQQEAKTDQTDGPREPPQSARRKRSYKQAVVRPLRTFLHTVQRNQMLMTPTSAPRSVMKSFIKRNTPLRVDPKCSFVEKERQRLENLRRKEEAEQLRRQKVEEDKRRRLEEVKLKREERLRKVLLARERVEQMKEEKKKQIEQKFAQIDEKTEKAKEERLAEEKAKKKAAAKKMEEVEARRKQEEEARRLRWLQQEEEERRHQELLQKKKEEEQERLRKAAEAKRLAGAAGAGAARAGAARAGAAAGRAGASAGAGAAPGREGAAGAGEGPAAAEGAAAEGTGGEEEEGRAAASG